MMHKRYLLVALQCLKLTFHNGGPKDRYVWTITGPHNVLLVLNHDKRACNNNNNINNKKT